MDFLARLDNSVLAKAIQPYLPASIQPGLAVIVAIGFVVLALGFVVLRLLTKKPKADTILLLGLPNSGKTVLFYKLRDGVTRETQTSSKENEAYFKPHLEKVQNQPGGPIHVVDIPGHERLRYRVRDFLPITAGIVFLIDSEQAATEITSIASYLYELFMNPHVHNRQIPILIACNKSELVTAYKKTYIQKQLEKELERLRVTKTSQVSHVGTDEASLGPDANFYLGIEGEKFSITEHAPTQVEFVEVSLVGDETDESSRIAEIVTFMRNCVH